LHRCGLFPDRGIAPQAEAAYAAAKAAREKDPKADGVDREVYAGALCVTASGSHAALEQVAKYAETQWGKHANELRTALEAVRDETATAFALEMVKGERVKKVAGLHMLAGCGTKSAIAPLRPLLDDTDNSIRVATINALRGIVDGDPPIANLPVFEAIELAKKWKDKAR
jgi:HEAT repeat protein